MAVSKKRWQEVGGMIPDSLATEIIIVIQAPDKTSARESGDEAKIAHNKEKEKIH